jgi:hypothetical protein
LEFANSIRPTEGTPLSCSRVVNFPSREIYSWVVIATVNGREVISPPVSMPEAKFKVLEEVKAIQLSRLKGANSHLALGVFYALEGMAAEAKTLILRSAFFTRWRG